MRDDCGCCEGVEKLTPAATSNRPGLSALSYRVGTHGSFLATMKARLSNLYLEFKVSEDDPNPPISRPLQSLTTRSANDPAIAFLDAWATVADVLTFYQQSIANEGYLRTAIERRSVLELARLIGYKLRPGVAASVYLAYTLDKGSEDVLIPEGNAVQSTPGPGEKAQTFETSRPLKARFLWNNLQPRLSRPQSIASWQSKPDGVHALYLKGTATKLQINDPLLVVLDATTNVYRVTDVLPDTVADRTLLHLIRWNQTLTVVGTSSISGAGGPTSDADAASPGTAQAVEDRTQSTHPIAEAMGHHLDLESAGVSSGTVTAKTVKSHLNRLITNLTSDMSAAEAEAFINQDILPELREVQAKPGTKRSASLSAWVDNIITELELAAGSLSTGLAAGSQVERAEQPVEDSAAEAEISPPPTQATMIASAAPASLDDAPTPAPRFEAAPVNTFQNTGGFIPTQKLVGLLSDELTRAASPRKKETEADAAISRRSISIDGGGQDVSSIPDTALRLLGVFNPTVKSLIYQAIANAPVTLPSTVEVYALRLQAGLFGNRANKEPQFEPERINEGTTQNPRAGLPLPQALLPDWPPAPDEDAKLLYLDNEYRKILPKTYVAVLRPDKETPAVYRNDDAVVLSRNAYSISQSTTRISLPVGWWNPHPKDHVVPDKFSIVRGTTVFAQAELLPLAEEPITKEICSERIELDGIYDGLEAGRWLIISGERTDLEFPFAETIGSQPAANPATTATEITHSADTSTAKESESSAESESSNAIGVQSPESDGAARSPRLPITGILASELVKLDKVEHVYQGNLAGDTLHSTLVLSVPPKHCYKLDTVKIYGNVVEATHGETRREILGSGDGRITMQTFTLRQSPLTYVSAPTVSGVETTLQVRVNDILWHEEESLAWLAPTDRNYITQADDENQTSIIFGNGERGARPSTGIENIKAVYRSGIGKPGNVKAKKLTSMPAKPLGVKEVVNPLEATGGADSESRDQARRNAPLAVMSLDRLVSVRDYEDFARTFAGIGKASAVRLTDGIRQVVHLTIAGADDIPISPTSDLFKNLYQSLHKFGDPYQPVKIAVRQLLVLAIVASVRLHPDYLWEVVEPKIRQALLDRLSFAERELGQDVLLSEVISAIQAVEGVVYVDVDKLDAIESDYLKGDLRSLFSLVQPKKRVTVKLAEINPDAKKAEDHIRPAQLAFLSPLVSETLTLTELKV